MRSVKCSAIGLGLIALTLMVLGIVVQFVIEGIVVKQAEEMLPMKDDTSALFQPWVDHGGYGSPIYNYFSVWNLTNPEDYLRGGRPKMELVGPFVYRMYDWKEDLEWHGDNRETVSFTYHNYNVYLPERSTKKYSLKSKTIMPNYGLQGVMLALDSLDISQRLRDLAMDAVAAAIGHEGFLMTDTVEELIFGVEERLFREVQLALDALHDLGIAVNQTIEDSKVQLQYIDTKEFYQSKSSQYSGTSDYAKTAEFITWCGRSDLSQYWPDAPEIEGTDGWNFPPQPPDTLNLFVDALPAVLTLGKQEKYDVKGIHTHKYYITEDIFRNDSQFARTHFASDMPGGLINLTSVNNASIFLSNPYFYNADPVYRQLVDMPPPDAGRDSTWMAVEPITGSAVEAQQVIQINLKVDPYMCDLYRRGHCNISEAMIPLMLTNQYIDIPSNEADELKTQIYGTPSMIKTVGWIMFGLSFGILLWAYILLRHIKQVEGSFFGGKEKLNLQGESGYGTIESKRED